MLGVDGYREKQGLVCETRARIQEGVLKLGFEVLGNPLLGLIAFRHPDFHSYALYGEIYKRGWFTSVTTEPKSLHLMLSPKHSEVVDEYLSDLADSMETVAGGALDGERVKVRYS